VAERGRQHEALLTIEQRQLFTSTLINELRGGFNRSHPREDVNPLIRAPTSRSCRARCSAS
jgi:hypothetical protein